MNAVTAFAILEVRNLNFFEKELRKIIDPLDMEATYVGRACFVRLGEKSRAKIHFATRGIADHYNNLCLSVINAEEGKVDTTTLRLGEVFSTAQTRDPHIWEDRGRAEWYNFKPTQRDYDVLTDAVGQYLQVFQEMTQEAGQGFSQQMM